MNKTATLIGLIFVLGSLDIARGQIALSSYFCESAIATSPNIKKSCGTCNKLFISRVVSADRSLLPYVYSYCFYDGSVSLDVGIGRHEVRTLITYICGENDRFTALDPSKTTKAAEFFISCTDTVIYKCPSYQVFDQALGRCVAQARPLSSRLPCPKVCGLSAPQVPLTSEVCGAKLFGTLRPTCATCASSFVGQAITETVQSVPGFYTFCAENGQFSLDTDYALNTFFAPYCTGASPLSPLDASKTSTGAKFFWDCRLGLIACNGNRVFDPATNKCLPSRGGYLDGPHACPKTCPYQPGLSIY